MEKKNLEYLARLRKAMSEHGIDATVISGTGPTSRNSPTPLERTRMAHRVLERKQALTALQW